MKIVKRTLGHSGIEVSVVRMGFWAIARTGSFFGNPAGWNTDRLDAIHEVLTSKDAP